MTDTNAGSVYERKLAVPQYVWSHGLLEEIGLTRTLNTCTGSEHRHHHILDGIVVDPTGVGHYVTGVYEAAHIEHDSTPHDITFRGTEAGTAVALRLATEQLEKKLEVLYF